MTLQKGKGKAVRDSIRVITRSAANCLHASGTLGRGLWWRVYQARLTANDTLTASHSICLRGRNRTVDHMQENGEPSRIEQPTFLNDPDMDHI